MARGQSFAVSMIGVAIALGACGETECPQQQASRARGASGGGEAQGGERLDAGADGVPGGAPAVTMSYPAAGAGIDRNAFVPPPPPQAPPDPCNVVGAAPLLRAGCPAVAPAVGDCSEEGVECLYDAATQADCYDVWECQYGLWSPGRQRCQAEGGAAVDNDPACPPGYPALDTPCEPHDLECGYGLCWTGSVEAWAICGCGRWVAGRVGCPTVP